MTYYSIRSFLKHFTITDYVQLLKSNRNYRFYLLSHVCQHAGDWFVHVASLIAIERIDPDSSTAISLLVLTKTIPDTLFTPIGGLLADTYDRRRIMIALDCVASLVVMGYLLAIRWSSLRLFLAVNTLRSVIHALYEPATRSITPLIVTEAADLKRAVTFHSCVWSGMMVMGGVVGGYATAYMGLQICYAIDSFSYLVSAYTMTNVTGSYVVLQSISSNHAEESQGINTDSTDSNNANSMDKDIYKKSVPQRMRAKLYLTHAKLHYAGRMLREFGLYLTACGFGWLVLMKATGTTSWGIADVINVSLSHVDGDEALSSKRLGQLFSCYGLGCFLGPVLVNPLVDAHQPAGLQLACICAFAFIAIGWIGISHEAVRDNYNMVCFFTTIRAMGGSVIWIDSTLILQTLTSKEMLGRVLGFEYSLAQLCEAGISFLSGRLEDTGYPDQFIALVSAGNATLFLILWSIFHMWGGGAANRRFNSTNNNNNNNNNNEGQTQAVIEML